MTDPEDPLQIVRLRLFAGARERAGTDLIEVLVRKDARLGDLRVAVAEQFDNLRPISKHLLLAIGTEYATDDTPIPDGREVVAFPPVSGG